MYIHISGLSEEMVEGAGAVEWVVPSKSGGMCEQEHLGLCASLYA